MELDCCDNCSNYCNSKNFCVSKTENFNCPVYRRMYDKRLFASVTPLGYQMYYSKYTDSPENNFYYEQFTEDLQFEFIDCDIENIRDIEFPCDNVCKYVISNHTNCIHLGNKPSEEIKKILLLI